MKVKSKEMSLDEYLKSINVDLSSLKCKHCNRQLVDLNDIKDVKVKIVNGKVHFLKNETNYIENEQNRWIVCGKKINGKIYRREICWDCFFEKVDQYIREPGHLKRLGKFRNGKQWNRDFYNGIYRVPSNRSTLGSNLNQFLFDIPKEELEKQRKKFSTASREYWIKKLGKKDGLKKYNELVSRQSYTASSKYLIEEKGLSTDEAMKFHINRASTRENFIKRYGEDLGMKYWNEYCKHEAWAGCALEYFIDKFGPTEGKKRYEDINKAKGFSLDNLIRKYGEEKGPLKYNEYYNSRLERFKTSLAYSKVSQKLFDELLEFISDKENVHYALHNGEVSIKTNDAKAYLADFTYHNKIIEFNGTYWHADPRNYKDDDLIRENVTAKDIHDFDKMKLSVFKKHGYDVLVIWESDYMLDQKGTINKCLEFLNVK